ncbi:MAG: type II secretion system protein GspN [Bdellovibrionales bacterium RIFOXYD12_FULL_39_22]|nr:MAG: type II secretion system protein GspN [Bdellovibrionales bacterium RIFOXYB1_FULL_39_21]OFZ41285.1 MAG: type II secretion system protein GspN [Bdellovibrionales bacterium RIFOXYC12_FULL_39_17]OFZ45065.1 MAG: type II secretion system protein GspN [Bdellovibrionales bacterium RIFOXYC1_FULL_39_130]OFZ70776.1 MAG: type II secretion system protein GspN [Bdellovibrionales bacterium RIFOXYC2_FULL_39_8]OFZ74449.1 MAG: type II secretion system protein GspN [Bdellovibrionales bacterium RIFOXYD1_FU
MKSNKQIAENSLDEKIYELDHINKFLITSLVIIIAAIGIIWNFPVQRTIKQVMGRMITSNPGCPIAYQKLGVSFLLPKIYLEHISLPASCLQMPTPTPIELPYAEISFRGPSFYPVGVKFKLHATHEDSFVNIYSSLSLNQTLLKIEDTTITSNTIGKVAALPINLNGTFNITSLLSLKSSTLTEAQFLIKSNNFLIPPQNFNGLAIPALPIGTLSLKGKYSGNSLDIENIVIGTENSPITANLYGRISINPQAFNQSILDMTGEIKFSESFINDFAILNLFLGGKTAENGFYKIKISGTLANPSPSVL